jgi:hypothetical protein
VPVFFDGAPQYRVLQVWPVGALMWSVVAIGVARAIAARRPVPRHIRMAAFVLAGVVLAVAPIALAFADSAGPDDRRAARAVGLLAAQVAPRLEHRTAYEITVQTNQLFVGGAVEFGLMRELLRRGDDIRVDRRDEYLGRSHAAPAHAPRLVVCSGRRTAAPAGARVEQVAALALATPGDVDHMHALDQRLHDYLTAPDHLTAHGRAVLMSPDGDPDGAVLRRVLDPATDPQRDNDTLVLIAHTVVSPHDHTFQRLRADVADAHTLVDDYVLAVYLVTPDNTTGAGYTLAHDQR